MFFVARRLENPALFGALYDQIPSDLDTHESAETLEDIVKRFVAGEILVSSNGELKPGPKFGAWMADTRPDRRWNHES